MESLYSILTVFLVLDCESLAAQSKRLIRKVGRQFLGAFVIGMWIPVAMFSSSPMNCISLLEFEYFEVIYLGSVGSVCLNSNWFEISFFLDFSLSISRVKRGHWSHCGNFMLFSFALLSRPLGIPLILVIMPLHSAKG